MAPYSLKSAGVELHESEIAKPQPLRIIKRSQTVTGSSARGETIGGGREWSGSSGQIQGSPPLGPDRPLTVHKLRKGRPTILSGGLDGPPDRQPTSAISDLITKNAGRSDNCDIGAKAENYSSEQAAEQDDPETTPKAHQAVPRTSSAGAFLKAEFYRGNTVFGSARFSMRSSRSSYVSDPSCTSPVDIAAVKMDKGTKSPQRRFSKSKSFLLRAIGGRSSEDGKSSHRVDSGASRTTLIRRVSRSRSKSSASHTSSDYSSSTVYSLYSERRDSADIGLASTVPYESSSSPRVSASLCSASTDQSSSPSPRDIYILCPEITITPEVPSVDLAACTVWVAVEITGILRLADGHVNERIQGHRCPSQLQNTKLCDLQQYGSLHSMKIDLIPASDCSVIEILGNLHDPKTIRASETHLVIAKMRLKKHSNQPAAKETSPDVLIADLEGHLCDVAVPYLTVRITYEHSGFPANTPASPGSGELTTSHTTLIQTKAGASIKRANAQSAWSPRTSQTMSTPLASNPVISLIERHLPPYMARDAIRRLANERVQIPLARRFANRSDPAETSGETVTSTARRLGLKDRSACASEASEAPLTPLKTVSEQVGSFDSDDTPGSSDDPARKIWAEMRRTSRGGQLKPRRASRNASGNGTAYFTVDEGTQESDSEKERIGSRSIDFEASPFNDVQTSVQQERKQILEVALRNQRSLGTETLRSFAPSITGPNSMRNGGTARGRSGLGSVVGGVGLGRSWGWTALWG